MTGGRIHNLIHFLRSAAAPAQAIPDSDAALLHRYAMSRDEGAFAAVAARHAAMVLGVCRRVLGNAADAEDAFQATFLVLARKAHAAAQYRSVGGWLHTVAFRVALRAQARRANRIVRRVPLPDVPSRGPDPAAEASFREVRNAIDHEVGRLPEKYRVPFVLHYFEGRNAAEVAHELGCPVGTVESWLARARERLRSALARRKLALAPALLAALAIEDGRALAHTAAWTQRALATARRAPDGGVSAEAEALANAVLRMLPVGRGKVIALAVAIIALLGVMAAVAAAVLAPETPPPESEIIAQPALQPQHPAPRKDGQRQLIQRGALTGHTQQIAALALSSDGRVLASADVDSHIKWWDLATMKQQQLLKPTIKKRGDTLGEGYQQLAPQALLLRADDRTLLSGGGDAWIRVWDLDRRVDVSAFTRHSVPVLALAVSPDGTRMLSVAAGYLDDRPQKPLLQPPCQLELKLWDLTKHEEIAGFSKIYGRTRFLQAAISPDLRTVALAGRDGKVLLWDTAAGDEVASLTVARPGIEALAVRAVAISPDGVTLAAAITCYERQSRQTWHEVKVWDLQTLKPRFTVKRQDIAALAFSPDGTALAVGGSESDPLAGGKTWGEIWLRDAANGQPRGAPLLVAQKVRALAFSGRGNVLVSGGEQGQLTVWDLAP
jgi:RNA polymerase sigma factor (sigma-70 family)